MEYDTKAHILENMSDLFLNVAADGAVLYVNQAVIEALGYSRDEALQLNLFEMVSEASLVDLKHAHRLALESGSMIDVRIDMIRRNGSNVLCSGSITRKLQQGKETSIRMMLSADSAAAIEMRRLARLAATDELTGLLNRRGFVESAGTRLGQVDGGAGGHVWVGLADIDELKRINDAFGHPAGDRLLKGAAEVIQHTLRGSDLMARWAGDEFIMLGCGLEPDPRERIVQRFERNVAEWNSHAPEPFNLGLSVGLVMRTPGEALDALVVRADEAMYADKRAKRESGGS